MALKLKLKKEAFEALPADVKKEYTLVGDEATLDVDGIEDTGALKRARDREKQRADDLDKDVTELRTRNETLERGKAGDVERLQKRWEKEKEELVETSKKEIEKRDAHTRKSMIDSATTAAASKLNAKSPKIFEPHIRNRLDVDMTGEEPKLIVKDKDGKPSKLTVDDLHKEFVADKEFSAYITGSQASGSAGTGNNNKLPASGAAGSNNGSDGTPDISKMDVKRFTAHLKAQKEARAENQNNNN